MTIRMADERDFREKVKTYSELLTCGLAFHAEVMAEAQNGGTYQQAYERVESKIENAVGRRHYSDYGSYRVIKCRIQARASRGATDRAVPSGR